jgi:hypothetical protein
MAPCLVAPELKNPPFGGFGAGSEPGLQVRRTGYRVMIASMNRERSSTAIRGILEKTG